MVQLRGVQPLGVKGSQEEGVHMARHSKPFFYAKGHAHEESPEAGMVIINEDGVNNTYYLPGAPTLDGGFRVKYEPPYRYYLMSKNTDDYSKEEHFYQPSYIGKTFSVDIEFTNDGPSCGCNLNFYLVDMPWSTPGSSNDYYCDAQCFFDHGCCAEFDINEGNMNVQQATNHACTNDYGNGWVCSKGGNPYDKTHAHQFGRGENSRINSRKPFTYATKFEKVGNDFRMEVTISQDGKSEVLSLNQGRQMNAMMEELEKGMVFVTGYWAAPDMNWMDGEECGGGAEHCNMHPAYVSNWRLTTNPPPVPTPAPPPGTGKCCWGGCSNCAEDPSNWCNKGGEVHCTVSCSGQWCR